MKSRAKVGLRSAVGLTLAVGALGAVTGAALTWASAAFACTNLATISLSSGWGHPGENISLVGSSFPAPRGTVPTPVVIHWQTSDGPVLATLTPDRTGGIATTFTIPPAQPGQVMIVALQRRPVPDPDNPDGPPKTFVDEAGTPARTTFRILAPGEMAPATTTFAQIAATNGDDGSTGLVILMVLFGAVAMSLFAGGVIAFLHQIRTQRPVPQELPAWPPW